MEEARRVVMGSSPGEAAPDKPPGDCDGWHFD
jgi:hypothetical protein